MAMKTKIMLMVLGLLIVGVAIGALGSATLRQNRGDRIDRMRPEQRFAEVMEGIIQPHSEQREAIDKILKEQSEQIAEIQERYQSEIIEVIDSSRRALHSLLTVEQQQRLRENIEKGSEQFIRMRIDRLTEMLQLDDQQRKQIEEIYRRGGGRIMGFRRMVETDSVGDVSDVREAMKKLDEKIEAVLTPGQREKFQEFRQQRQQRGLRFRQPFRHYPYEKTN